MEARSPFERIQELVNLIELNPTPSQLVRFISRNICLSDEVCGVGWLKVVDDGKITPIALSGLKNSLDPQETVWLSDDNIVAESLRIRKPLFFDMQEIFKKYADSTHEESLSTYRSGMLLPIDVGDVIGIALVNDFEEVLEFRDYFELIKTVISLWIEKTKFEKSEKANARPKETSTLTKRQAEILSLIKDGLTNIEIGSKMGYSESLIKQESMSIYRKLGVEGRGGIVVK